MKHFILILWIILLVFSPIIAHAQSQKIWEKSFPYFKIAAFQNTSSPSNKPMVDVKVDKGYKIIGGGGQITYNGNSGCLIYACYPSDSKTWTVRAKDHIDPCNSCIAKGWAIAIYDPCDEWDVIIKSNVSILDQHPSVSAIMEEGYVLTGGGAKIEYRDGKTPGVLLTASIPSDNKTWYGKGKDHSNNGKDSDTGTITSYAIGIKHRDNCGINIENKIWSAYSPKKNHPEQMVTIDTEYVLTGGGANTNFTGGGNLLTSTFPNLPNNWSATSKDHASVIEAVSLTVSAIGIRVNNNNRLKPLALLIGNSDYLPSKYPNCLTFDTLAKAISNLKEIKKNLEGYGIDVIEGYNLHTDSLNEVFYSFYKKINEGRYNFSMIIYTGHGFNSNGIDYIVPIDALKQISKKDCKSEKRKGEFLSNHSLDFDHFVRANRNYPSLIIIDACRTPVSSSRSNTAGKSSIFNVCTIRSGERGLESNGDLLNFLSAYLNSNKCLSLDVNQLISEIIQSPYQFIPEGAFNENYFITIH